MTNDMTTNEQAGGESRNLDISQFEGMTYCVKERESDGCICIFGRRANVVIAEFVLGTKTDAERIRQLLDAVPSLIAEVKRLREENVGLKRNRCDHCGAATTGPCPDCGAPQCCPKCCAIDRLTTERDSLRADVERLTRERDEARGLAIRIQNGGKLVAGMACDAITERDEARARIAELERLREACEKEFASVEHLNARLLKLWADVEQLTHEKEKLSAFKAYVHKRLDDAGIPVDPESPHKAEGCRIGGRLDVVFARIAELERDREALREENNRLSMELTAVTNPPDGNAL